VTRLRAVALACALIVPLTGIGNELVHLSLSAEAQRCCASTNGECAGLSSPDECCQVPDQVAGHGDAAVTPDPRSRVAPEQPIIGPPVIFRHAAPAAEAVWQDSRDRLKRPHDPPHLHPFPLLI
jgi:hypothetical protein